MNKKLAIVMYESLKKLDSDDGNVIAPMLNARGNPNNRFFRKEIFFRWLGINIEFLEKAGYFSQAEFIKQFLKICM